MNNLYMEIINKYKYLSFALKRARAESRKIKNSHQTQSFKSPTHQKRRSSHHSTVRSDSRSYRTISNSSSKFYNTTGINQGLIKASKDQLIRTISKELPPRQQKQPKSPVMCQQFSSEDIISKTEKQVKLSFCKNLSISIKEKQDKIIYKKNQQNQMQMESKIQKKSSQKKLDNQTQKKKESKATENKQPQKFNDLFSVPMLPTYDIVRQEEPIKSQSKIKAPPSSHTKKSNKREVNSRAQSEQQPLEEVNIMSKEIGDGTSTMQKYFDAKLPSSPKFVERPTIPDSITKIEPPAVKLTTPQIPVAQTQPIQKKIDNSIRSVLWQEVEKKCQLISWIAKTVISYKATMEKVYPKWIFSSYLIYKRFVYEREVIEKVLLNGAKEDFYRIFGKKCSAQQLKDMKHLDATAIQEMVEKNQKVKSALKKVQQMAKKLDAKQMESLLKIKPYEIDFEILYDSMWDQINDLAQHKDKEVKIYLCHKVDTLLIVLALDKKSNFKVMEKQRIDQNPSKYLKQRIEQLNKIS